MWNEMYTTKHEREILNVIKDKICSILVNEDKINKHSIIINDFYEVKMQVFVQNNLMTALSKRNDVPNMRISI
jgi:hypothetical protein